MYFLNLDEIEDETDFVQFGQSENFSYFSLKFQEGSVSSWTSYPDHYKFVSVDIELNLHSMQTNRVTYSVLDLFGDSGGLLEILTAFFTVVALPFSKMRL